MAESSTELIPPLIDAKEAGQYTFLTASQRLVSSRNKFSVLSFVRSLIILCFVGHVLPSRVWLAMAQAWFALF